MWYIIKFQRLKWTKILGLTEPQIVNKNNGQKCKFMWCLLVIAVMFNGDDQRLLRWQWQLFINIYFHVRIQPWGHPSKFWSPNSLGQPSTWTCCQPSIWPSYQASWITAITKNHKNGVYDSRMSFTRFSSIFRLNILSAIWYGSHDQKFK